LVTASGVLAEPTPTINRTAIPAQNANTLAKRMKPLSSETVIDLSVRF
jgi:hypothetical protein